MIEIQMSSRDVDAVKREQRRTYIRMYGTYPSGNEYPNVSLKGFVARGRGPDLI